MSQCPEGDNNRKRKGKQHALAANIDEHPKKSKGDKYLFYFSAITGFTAVDDDMWLVDSGASIHMIGDHVNLNTMMERILSQRVYLGDNHRYATKAIGKTSIELESGNNVHLNNVLYMPGLRKN